MALMSQKHTHVTAPVTKRGRPRIAAAPLTAAERARRSRAQRKARPKPVRSADEVFEALCESRNLTSAFDRALAQSVTDSLCAGDLAEAVRGMAHLPPVVRAEVSSPSMGISAAREQFRRQVMNAVAAHQLELAEEMTALATRLERGEEVGERDQLRLRLHMLDEQAAALPEPEEATKPADEVETLRARVAELEARLGETPPPPEQPTASRPTTENNPRRLMPADDWNPKPVTVIDLKPTVLDVGAPVAAPQPTEPGQWDRSDSGRAWASWRARNPDGYGGGGVV
jgi:hypothetical protein